MMTQKLNGTDYTVSRLMMGCMRTGGAWNDSDPEREVIDKALRLFEAALGAGINHFDHADIYGRGPRRAEQMRHPLSRRSGCQLPSQATGVELSREEWYALFTRSRGQAVP